MSPIEGHRGGGSLDGIDSRAAPVSEMIERLHFDLVRKVRFVDLATSPASSFWSLALSSDDAAFEVNNNGLATTSDSRW